MFAPFFAVEPTPKSSRRFVKRLPRMGKDTRSIPPGSSSPNDWRVEWVQPTNINQRPDTGLKAPPALGGSAMVARPTRRQIDKKG